MPRILHRISLHDQLIEVLRQDIKAGRWSEELPSERVLCGELHVSRPTLRKALAQLIRERLVTRGGNRRRHLIRQPSGARAAPQGTIIRILIPYSHAAMGSINAAIIETLSERLGSAGYRVEIENRFELFSRYRPAELQRLNSLPDTAGWVLFLCTEKMQRWFAASGRPCLVIGRTSEGVQLPSIYFDAQEIARHAVGLFYRRGHRNLVFLMAEFTSLNDRLASEAFVQEAGQLGISARIMTHRPAVRDLRRVLDQLIAFRPRPTGFYSGCPEHCLTILCQLLNAGLRIPSDAAVISGWADYCLDFVVPAIAHYQTDGTRIGRKAATMVLDLLRHGPCKLSEVRIVPDFIFGETLGTVR